MNKVTLAYAAVLIALGGIAYALSGATTALIPAYFGVPFVILGALAFNHALRKHVMHVAAALALLMIFGLGRMVLKGHNPERPLAFPTQLIALLATLTYLALAVNSFIQARRARGQTANPAKG